MVHLELVAELKGHTDRAWQISWHPNGSCLASCSGDKTVIIWEPSDLNGENPNWHRQGVLDGFHERTVRTVAYSPSGRVVATGSFDGTTGVWEKDTSGDYECVATLEGHENEVKSIAWSASGSLIATCSRDKSVWIWEAASDDDFECLAVLQEHSQDVKMVKWHPKRELLASASYDDTIRIWEDEDDDWLCSNTLEGHESTVWALDFDAEGNQLVSVSADMKIKIWKCYTPQNNLGIRSFSNSLPTWKCICTLSGFHSRAIYTVSWSKHHGRIATAGSDNKINIFEEDPEACQDADAPTYVLAASVNEPHGVSDINCVQWNPTEAYSDLLASTGDDGIVRIWRLVQDI
ncbi:WD40 repeat-like protein [Basidiobolus meristosporus CBS 931.73]|uniref:Probable cytosolic iron-sulfur protein assembly protein 1 n=1 Tax=Basidiobolus meristosporus CBS 931.73 TaxID=1314790 RepID=A0A1Y1X9A0_9FUNG|nr:WD40 repeat-like protein [Basidiobolus meristosporus CBS 931.73]|eukprot:ORX82309.1 WD40 repeat-like protein [Basidiobolus meristosporus CBS 931.73]